MKITDIRIRKTSAEGKMRAVVSVTFDDAFVVHDIKIIDGNEKMFVAMPSRKDENGAFRDIVHPITPQARKIVEEGTIEEIATEKRGRGRPRKNVE